MQYTIYNNDLIELNTLTDLGVFAPTAINTYQTFTLNETVNDFKLLIIEPRYYTNINPQIVTTPESFIFHNDSNNRYMIKEFSDRTLQLYSISDTEIALTVSDIHCRIAMFGVN